MSAFGSKQNQNVTVPIFYCGIWAVMCGGPDSSMHCDTTEHNNTTSSTDDKWNYSISSYVICLCLFCRFMTFFNNVLVLTDASFVLQDPVEQKKRNYSGIYTIYDSCCMVAWRATDIPISLVFPFLKFLHFRSKLLWQTLWSKYSTCFKLHWFCGRSWLIDMAKVT